MYISLAAAAKEVGFSVSTLRRFAAEGRLKLHRVSPTGHYRVKRSDLDQLLQAPEPPPPVDMRAVFAAVEAQMGLKKSIH